MEHETVSKILQEISDICLRVYFVLSTFYNIF